MALNLILLALLVATVVAAGVFSRRAAQAAFMRGRREAELEVGAGSSSAVATATARADDLATRLAAAEARLVKAEETFRDQQSQKGALETIAGRVPTLEAEIKGLRDRYDLLRGELAESEKRAAGFESQLREIKEREPQLKEALAAFLQAKGESLTKHNTETLKAVLDPLSSKLQEFKVQIETSHKEGRDQHIQLKTQIEGLLGMNQRLSQEAQNLAVALKGENKASGNWGEIVLERVLEMSGLEKGREYDVQQAYTNEDGQRKLPDAVVFLPEQRQLIIDSKVSLVSYERYCSAENPESASAELQAHINSVKQHVKNLAEQRYQDLPGLKSPDFVFLFMPIEPAFILAVKEDAALFQQAFERNIVIVSPSTLLATLRTVANIWKQENRSRNAEEIARLAGGLYDKFVGFLEDLDTIGESLGKAQERFEEARKKLKTGKGNLIGSVERIRVQGAKAKKRIDADWKDADQEIGLGDNDDESPTLTLDESRP